MFEFICAKCWKHICTSFTTLFHCYFVKMLLTDYAHATCTHRRALWTRSQLCLTPPRIWVSNRLWVCIIRTQCHLNSNDPPAPRICHISCKVNSAPPLCVIVFVHCLVTWVLITAKITIFPSNWTQKWFIYWFIIELVLCMSKTHRRLKFIKVFSYFRANYVCFRRVLFKSLK